jgi:hypothetical protein
MGWDVLEGNYGGVMGGFRGLDWVREVGRRTRQFI